MKNKDKTWVLKNFRAFGALCIIVPAAAWGIRSLEFTKPLMHKMGKETPYEQLWATIDSLEQNGMYTDADRKTQELLSAAKEEKNDLQRIRALMYRGKYIEELEEDSRVKFMDMLAAETELSAPPLRNILHSIQAQVLYGELSSNYYRISARTEVSDASADINSWTLTRFEEAIEEQFSRSLENRTELLNTDIKEYRYILTGSKETEPLRPTLYDLLAFRALDYYASPYPYLQKSLYTSGVDDSLYFSEAAAFLNTDIRAEKEPKVIKALELIKDIMRKNMAAGSEEALADADFRRIQMMRGFAVSEKAEQWFKQALERQLQVYKERIIYPDLLLMQAQLKLESGNAYQKDDPYDTRAGDIKEAVAMYKNIVQRFPAGYAASEALAQLGSLEYPALNVQVENINAPGKSILAKFDYRNMKSMQLRIVKINGEEWIRKEENGNQDSLLQELKNLPAVYEKQQELPLNGLYREQSAELILDALPAGTYILLASGNGAFDNRPLSSYTPLNVTNIGFYHRSEGTKMMLRVFDIQTQKPLEGANVSFYKRRWTNQGYNTLEKLREGNSGKDGWLRLIRKESYYESYSYVRIVYKGQELILPEGVNFNSGSSVRTDREETVIFTDRKIYRPGQTVFFKGIQVMRKRNASESRVVAGKRIRIKLNDANYQEAGRQDLLSNEYGSFSGSFVLPASGSTGRYTLTADNGSSSFAVEEYKRPTFEAKINAPEKSYKLGETVHVKAEAKALAGYGIGNADVVYYIERSASFPRWCWWAPVMPAKRIALGSGKTDAAGNFEIAFGLDPDPSVAQANNPVFSYNIVADITDEAGETRTARYNLRAGYTSIELFINAAASADISSDSLMHISAKNLAGREQATDVQVEIVKLQRSKIPMHKRIWAKPDTILAGRNVFEKQFPHLAWADEDEQEKMPVAYTLLSKTVNTANFSGLAMSALNRKPEPGLYRIRLSATDHSGTPVKAEHYIELTDQKAKELKEGPAFEVIGVKTQAEPGEKASLLLRSAMPNTLVDIRVIRENQTLHYQQVQLSREQKLIYFDVPEEYRGNFSVSVIALSEGRFYSKTVQVIVPFSNKQFRMEFETIRRTFLPGSEQEWTITFIPNRYTAENAAFRPELLLAMYDAALDAFSPNSFNAGFFGSDYFYEYASSPLSRAASARTITGETGGEDYEYFEKPAYQDLNLFGYNPGVFGMYSSYRGSGRGVPVLSGGLPAEMDDSDAEFAGDRMFKRIEAGNVALAESSNQNGVPPIPQKSDIQENTDAPRSNFNETAFFFPQLYAGADGKLSIRFKAPESLTRWKILGFAHTQDLQTATLTEEVTAKKELMISTFAPRFFNEGDELSFSAKVVNLSETVLSGKGSIQFFNGITGEDISSQVVLREESGSFEIKPGESSPLSWRLKIPQQISLIRYIVKASSGTHSDGEEGIRPVLSNRILLTEALAFGVRGKQSKSFSFTRLSQLKSPTLRSERLVLEFTSNPAWYAIQSLPYLMEYPYECAEQTFARYYANTIGAHLVNSQPEIRQVFEAWKTAQPSALQSALEKNQDLKNVLLEESPWVRQAQSDAERKRRLALLFDINRVQDEQRTAMQKLQQMQMDSGGFPWFKGGQEDRFITQHIVTGFGKMQKMGIKDSDGQNLRMAKRALEFLDSRMRRDYEQMKKNLNKKQMDEWKLSSLHVHYLYTRSFYPEQPVQKENSEMLNFLESKAAASWTTLGRGEQAMLALYMQRILKDQKTPLLIMNSIKNRAIHSEELGMYWKGMLSGFYWYEQPIEDMALMIEAFDEVLNDAASVDEMKLWLLKNKQTNDWKSTRATTEAIYALMKKGGDWVVTEGQSEIQIGPQKIDMTAVKAEAGTGYFRKEWNGADIKPEMGNISVTQNAAVPAWGALYWQYTEEMDKVSAAGSNFTIQRSMFKQVQGATGATGEQLTEKTALKPGDRVLVRLVFTTDRPLEYVHIKDRRASGLEPENVFSGYRWQDGLGYYESTRDAATHFFISHVPRGTFVFSYYARVTHKGEFSGGMASAQCMYAPEFTAHSNGSRLNINGK